MSNTSWNKQIDVSTEIVFLGAAHLDRTGWLDEQGALHRSNPGRFQDFPGGAALNVASNCAAMGVPSSLVTILGRDSAADTIQATANKRGVALNAQLSHEKATASYTSIVQPGGEMIIALADMAIYDDFRFDYGQLTNSINQQTQLLCFDANLPATEILEILDNSSRPVAAFTVSAAKAPRLKDHLPRIDMVFTNRAEALALCQLDEQETTESTVKGLQNLGTDRAVVSDGADKIWMLQDGEIAALEVPPLSQITDLTGAGDGLASGILVALINMADLKDAVEFGVEVAQKIIEVRGPYRDDLAASLSLEERKI